ncbi:DUF4145 domain-containing protein [Acinetobacter baumannii]|nr:DUF4145 domain-containing protein [Acinetobacter baumannii]MDO7404550.1 DUF4145 domain-containing protein [Acinetobacter baumannii]
MSTFIFDCPSCSAKNSTFDVDSIHGDESSHYADWDLFSICRACSKAMVITARVKPEIYNPLYIHDLTVAESTKRIRQQIREVVDREDFHLNRVFTYFIYSPVHVGQITPPEYLPEKVRDIFNEATKCLSSNCFNASGAMFRLCLDIVTKDILEKNEELGATRDDKKSIHSRLNWIFKHNLLNRGLEDLSRCIKDDGNDGAHDGNLTNTEADDLLDFTYELLEQVYTQPERIRLAQVRRQERRKS